MMDDDEMRQSDYNLSLDSAWVGCGSRKHLLHVGEAKRNLTESEIDKTKREAQYGNHFHQLDSCPEPSYPPQDFTNKHNAQIARVYNKQIINQFRQPLESVAYHQIMPATSMGPMSLQHYGVPNQFNSNVWAITPMNQVYITPPIVNQVIQPPNYPQSPSQMSARLDHIEIQMNQSPSPRKAHQRHQRKNNSTSNNRRKAMNWKTRNVINTPRFKAGPTDLRKILAEKRKQKELAENLLIITKKTLKADDLGMVSHKSRSGIDFDDYPQTDVDCDGDFLEENMSVCGTKLKLNLTNLKNLAKPDANTDIWYIVADRDIYINHLNFLNILLNSDEQCHLMMPRKVYSQLQATVDNGTERRRVVNRARRAIALFTQLLDAKVAVLGDTPDESEDGYVLNCFQILAERNYHAILLSNDAALHELKSETCVHIFTLKEIKQLISDSTTDQENIPIMPVSYPIMVTIDNDFCPNTEVNTAQKEDFGVQIESQECAQESPNNMSRDSEMCKEKHILDVGVQTDLESWETSDLGASLPSSQEQKGSKADQTDYIIQSQNNTNIDNLVRSEQNSTTFNVNKRAIRLNRNTAFLASKTNIDDEKRQYKWRARKATACQPSIGTAMPNDTNKCTESPVKLSENNTEFKIVENVQSSQASSLSHHTIPRWNMVLEETSTSGVISNSSEVDFERPNQLNTYYRGSNLTENVMFEVSDENMAQYLMLKQDEWVSRFVQIMEEVLTQVLQKDPPFFDWSMPPPWTIKEAAECIKLKFPNCHDVVQTARSFIDIIDRISDNGRIKVDQLPHQFMEMYSFGVHLVEMLQAVIGDCEDIATALDLLSRLLADIQNPNTDCSNHDSFGNMQDAHMDTTDVSHVSYNDTLTKSMDLAIDNIINFDLDINDIQHPDFETFGDNFHTGVTLATCSPENCTPDKMLMPSDSIVAQIGSNVGVQPNKIENHNTFRSPPLNLEANLPTNSGRSSKLDFTSNSPHMLTYHNFDSQSLLQSPQRHNALQSKLNDSFEIARNVTIDIIMNMTLKTDTNQIIENDIINADSHIYNETPKAVDNETLKTVTNQITKIDIINADSQTDNEMPKTVNNETLKTATNQITKDDTINSYSNNETPKAVNNETLKTVTNETLKTVTNQITKDDTIKPDSNIDNETPKIARSNIANPSNTLKPHQLDMLSAMDEIFDYEEDCCLEDIPETRNEPDEWNEKNVPTKSDDNKKASQYCKLVKKLAKIIRDVISFCESCELDIENEQTSSQTQIKAKKCGLKLLDVWKVSERMLRRNSGDQALESIPYSNREVLLKICDQAVVVIKWLNKINKHINDIYAR